MGRQCPPKKSGPEVELTVGAIGARGDGLAETAGGRVFLPLTAPGDRVRARLGPPSAEGRRGEVLVWLERGAGRAEPACRHFGRCGGCTLQHLAGPGYLAWKREQLGAALTRAGVGPADDQSLMVAATPPGDRRRASFTISRRDREVRAGFRERLSHRLVDLEACPVLAPALLALLPQVRRHLGAVLPEGGSAEAVATLLDGGVDLLLIGPPRLDLPARLALAELAEAADLGRLSWQPEPRAPSEPVAARRPLRAWFGGVAVEPPPGAFLQASGAGEAALIGAVLAGVGAGTGAGAVADLFCGCGTFSLPLAVAGWRVHGVDGNAAALAALGRAAAGRGTLTGPRRDLTTERRDLGREPLSAPELAQFSAVVFDPPRAGAAAQAAALAASAVPVVVAVSCNPATFARDARLLAGGGYRLTGALAVDQFLWSAHVELVAVFSRG
ncbi:MAG: class I SAM-dependent RNA methyltransferase [Rhodospirillaceae bacterium]